MSYSSAPLVFRMAAGKRSWPAFASLVLATSLLACCIYLAVRSYALEQHARQLNEQKEELVFLTERHQASITPRQAGAIDETLKDIQKKLNKEWLPLLAALDTTTIRSVSLLLIAPDAEHDSIRLEIEASSIEQAMAYIAALEKTTALDQVHLISQQPAEQKSQVLAGSIQPMLQFSLLARWTSP